MVSSNGGINEIFGFATFELVVTLTGADFSVITGLPVVESIFVLFSVLILDCIE